MNTNQEQLHRALQEITELEAELDKQLDKAKRFLGCLILASAELNIDWNALESRARELLVKGDE